MKCLWCHEDFLPARSDAIYCSDTCRSRAKNDRRRLEKIERHNEQIEDDNLAGETVEVDVSEALGLRQPVVRRL